MEKGVDPNSQEVFGKAARYGFLEIVKLLLEKGVDPNSQNALQEAANHGHTEVVKLLEGCRGVY